jgi:flagellar biosynthesis anti-sigma factor FlgM
MSIDKVSLNGSLPARGIPDSKVARLDSRVAANSPQQAARRAETTATLDPIRVSNMSRELSAALGPAAMDDTFDQDKVDSIRREILEGKFPLDEDRLASKFRELEKELGGIAD